MPVVTWNPSDKSSGVTLSNGNLTAATSAAAWHGQRANFSIGPNQGKRYWEIYINNKASGGNISIGIALATAGLTNYLGFDSYGTGRWSGDTPAYTTGNTVSVALDMNAGKLWIAINGTWVSGNPADGSSPSVSNILTTYPGSIFPAVTQYSSTITANFGASAFTYSIPSGFYAFNATPYVVTGHVYESSSPVARTVRVYQRDNGALVASGVSSAVDGSFSIPCSYNSGCYVVALDDDEGASYNALIFDRVVPDAAS